MLKYLLKRNNLEHFTTYSIITGKTIKLLHLVIKISSNLGWMQQFVSIPMLNLANVGTTTLFKCTFFICGSFHYRASITNVNHVPCKHFKVVCCPRWEVFKRSICAGHHTGSIWKGSFTGKIFKFLIISTSLHCIVPNCTVSIKSSNPGYIHYSRALCINWHIQWWVWLHCRVKSIYNYTLFSNNSCTIKVLPHYLKSNLRLTKNTGYKLK